MSAMDNVALFTEKAKLVSAVVSEIKSLEQAYQYATELCDQKEACQLLLSGCEAPLSDKAEDLCQLKEATKLIAAPALSEEELQKFIPLAKEKGISLIKDGIRNHLGGIDIGFTVVDYGIAETGTLVLDSSSEELRLSTMISEIHVAVLPKSKLRGTSFEVEKELEEYMQGGPNYTAFITGASRTADIERVLAIGVHGPLELHILLWEDK